MNEFPEFMRHPSNKIDPATQFTKGIEGYVFDGANGSQMAFWTFLEAGKSAEHVHEYDEYFVVVQGRYTLSIHGQLILMPPGAEYHIPAGVRHGGEAIAGTRTIHAFGGKRARRQAQR